VATYARDNMAVINMFIRKPYVKKFLTEEKITEISFVGTVGGLLGLFTGFSFVSAIEFIYLFFLSSPEKEDGRRGRVMQNKMELAKALFVKSDTVFKISNPIG
jgi:hypothetical protein